MTDNYDDLQASYGRCLRANGFIERFYEIFLASHADIAPMFAKTDFRQQRLALRRGISIAISHAAGTAMVKRSVGEMAQVHSRSGRTPVRPSLYAYWIDSLIAAVREKDPQVNPALLERWRRAMGVVVEGFSASY
ncbi:globin [Tahibacter sp. UC22_41]|uniref:globin n=1 Tax=Tahibacter sp. UC22_41 TaxID=3350178 RepID=UPI0036DC060B